MLYMNPGYGELFDQNIGTTIKDGARNPYNNVSFYRVDEVPMLNLPSGVRELWIKFNYYIKSGGSYETLGVYIGNHDNHYGIFGKYDEYYHIMGGWDTRTRFTTNVLKDSIHEMIIHLKSGVSDGIIEFWIDGDKIGYETRNIYSGKDFDTLFFCSYSTYTTYSNIIIADYDISDYFLTEVPLMLVDTTWAKQSDGTYKANDVNDYINQKINEDLLKYKISENVDNAEIIGVSVNAVKINYDNEKINSIRSAVNDTEIETLKISNNAIRGTSLLKDPVNNGTWIIKNLCTHQFKLTAEEI